MLIYQRLGSVGNLQKLSNQTEKLNNKVREALKYQRLRLFVLPLECHTNKKTASKLILTDESIQL